MRDYQTHVFTCTYTADVSGVCSAMYELGGMSIIHDPSGCNSTYSTHDEPRWFDGRSLMFVSGLDEMTAVLGDDSVLIEDAAHAAADLKPKFITLCGGSIPHIIAFDFRGTAHLIEKKTGIPVLPVPTDGLRSYISGVGMALTAWIKRFADPSESQWKRPGRSVRAGRNGSSIMGGNSVKAVSNVITDSDSDKARHNGSAPGNSSASRNDQSINEENRARDLSVNIIGVTPLDFSINGNVRALKDAFEDAGIPVNCVCAMSDPMSEDVDSRETSQSGITDRSDRDHSDKDVSAVDRAASSKQDKLIDDMRHIYRGAVNVVVSSAGRRPARYMEKIAGIPRVEGLPIGAAQTDKVIRAVRDAFQDGQSRTVWENEGIPGVSPAGTGAFKGSDTKSFYINSNNSINRNNSADNINSGADNVRAHWQIPEGQMIIIGEEIFSRSLASAINTLPPEKREGKTAYALWPDINEGLPEDVVIPAVRNASIVIADPLYRVCRPGKETRFIDFPHEAYSGRIYRDRIPVFAGRGFPVENLIMPE